MDCSIFLDGKTYSNNHRLVKEIVVDATRQYFPLEEFHPDGDNRQYTMLDLGCGTCENTKWFGSQVGAKSIVGIDWAFMHETRWQDPTIADWRTGPDPAGAFRNILTAAGFSVSVCDKMAFTYTTESEAECRGHLQWLVPFTSQLPDGDRAELMDDFMSVYRQFTRQEGPGQYVWENEVLVVLAKF
ncbi:hypothetical protein BOX15_Mlig022269g1 [Macrostomum lignano]|uniref:Methyltransferase domain-containing protein n=1 Tax=Macrostomum lignano TaxID=282301 RepID=A0A267FYW7_9PLAT|nr:hypothetical protein BOX15_Mlig022269g1 [Macrostomum lignano]